MDESLVIAIYYYDGKFYLPTCVRSIDGMSGMDAPIVVVPAGERATLADEIELKAIAGNPMLTRADFRAQSNRVLLQAMGLKTLQAFFEKTQRWSIVENTGAYSLIPFKPAPFRGVVEDREHALPLAPASFVTEALDHIQARLSGTK